MHTKTDNTQPTVTIVDSFTYDHVGRLISQVQKTDNNPKELITLNAYDELGQLVSKKVGGDVATVIEQSNGLQTVDYKYNVRGWLTNINDIDNIGADLFTFKINYNQTNIGGSVGLYNGNISETIWYTKNDVLNHSNIRSRAYSYKYDAMNRLHRADFKYETTSGSYSTQNYAEYVLSGVTYDKNGNIQKLTRFGNHGYYNIDNLTYTYDSGNKLMKVVDNGYSLYKDEGFKDNGSSSNDYAYDSNGNLKHDYNKSILSINYNHLNLPTYVGHAISGNINYTYDAVGNKLRKSVYKPHPDYSTTNTDYAGNFVYENNVMQFFSHPEGYVKYENGNFEYVYQYKDHLGNVRLSYNDKNNDGDIDVTTDPNTNELIEENNYYPFGMLQKGYNIVVSSNGNSSAQKYKYNGKELNDELGLDWYDYGARNYNASLGRWMNIDPLAEKYYSYSTYNYTLNNPIIYIDPDGRSVKDWYIDAKTGQLLGTDGAASNDIRVIHKEDYNDVKSENGGSTKSLRATAQLQSSSSIVTIDEKKIQSDINDVNNETVSDQSVERQTYIVLKLDSKGEGNPKAEVTSIRGKDGTDGQTEINAHRWGDGRLTVKGGSNILLAQAHSHNKTSDPTKTNVPGTSGTDLNTSNGFNIPIFSIDSYTGKLAIGSNGPNMHRVSGGVQTNFTGTTGNQKVGQEALKIFLNLK